MEINKFNETIFNCSDLIAEIYKGNLKKISLASVEVSDEIIKYLEFINDNALDDWPIPKIYTDSIYHSDAERQSKWFIPEEYKTFNMEQYLLDLCISPIERNRVETELKLFKEKNMLPVLIFLKFLIDTLREHKIVWGVGRGSSVASYCLYLLGVHKIDSIKYNLDINEFIR